MNTLDQLRVMAARIDSRADWFRFPEEESIKGFMGMGRVFIVGDQPSTSQWEYWHPNRRALYDVLRRVGVSDAHLTDLYKRRGKAGMLRYKLPTDFNEHLEFFREELALLRPTRVVALGDLACRLLSRHVPEVRPMLGKMWHFAYVARYNKLASYENNIRLAFNDASPSRSKTPPVTTKAASRESALSGRGSKSIKGKEMCMAVQGAPIGAHIRRWTLRNDNNGYHHGVVGLTESPFYLELSWRLTAADPPKRVGTFRLDLAALLTAGYIRPESSGSHGAGVRLRIVRAEDGSFYIQSNQNGPRILLSVD